MAFTRTDITRRFGRCMSFINEDFKFKLLIAASDGSTCSSRWMANGNGTASRKCTPSSAVQHTIGGKDTTQALDCWLLHPFSPTSSLYGDCEARIAADQGSFGWNHWGWSHTCSLRDSIQSHRFLLKAERLQE